MKNKIGNTKKTPRTTIASVNREMQKPRLTESVRNGGKSADVAVAEKPPVRA
jgi:hypothetical protein